MRILTGLTLLTVAAIFTCTVTAFRPGSAPGVRHFVKYFEQVGPVKCPGYLAFEAKFTGFAGRINVWDVQLFVVILTG